MSTSCFRLSAVDANLDGCRSVQLEPNVHLLIPADASARKLRSNSSRSSHPKIAILWRCSDRVRTCQARSDRWFKNPQPVMQHFDPSQLPTSPPIAPTIVIRPSSNRRVFAWLLAGFGLMLAMFAGLIVLLLIAAETGVAALIAAIVFATLPVPIYVILILWIDRYESEPLWIVALAFIWGASVAVFLAYLINTIGAIVVAAVLGPTLATYYGALISAPVFEESGKGLILFILFFWKKDEFDGVVDGFVYAAMVGLGFAMTENFQYYGRALLRGEFGQVYLLRGGFAAYSHPLFTAMTGIGLGIARHLKNPLPKALVILLGFGLAIFTHFLWNLFALLSSTLADFLVLYAVVMVPIFLLTLGVIAFSVYREGQVLRHFLLCDVQSGLLTQEEYDRLCSIRSRMRASFNALSSGGFGVWRARMKYNQTASELAFHRRRIEKGILKMEQSLAEREAAYVQTLQALRKQIGHF